MREISSRSNYVQFYRGIIQIIDYKFIQLFTIFKKSKYLFRKYKTKIPLLNCLKRYSKVLIIISLNFGCYQITIRDLKRYKRILIAQGKKANTFSFKNTFRQLIRSLFLKNYETFNYALILNSRKIRAKQHLPYQVFYIIFFFPIKYVYKTSSR